ncbi:Uncharacterised protein [Anaerobiospirillum thomasii]|uniref:pullulanase n=1 Tax=Anaerobiospirillum thomasii TaxID=179995 RepID=UPI000D9916D9|nr:pullulanase [Anaerobiospirillum thomasii]SPT71778.1 Uncharacterised protein [Anaerobiospirillum thomasii]
MKVMTVAACAASLLVLCSCQSHDGSSNLLNPGMSIDGREIYLRGEMNDYAVMSAYRLNKIDENTFCTVAPLRADWAPYRFKFADSAWSSGSNFGYAAPPGVLHVDGPKVKLNAASRFEELSFSPDEDGNYRFCLIKEGKSYHATVDKSDDELATLHDLLFNSGSLLSTLN